MGTTLGRIHFLCREQKAQCTVMQKRWIFSLPRKENVHPAAAQRPWGALLACRLVCTRIAQDGGIWLLRGRLEMSEKKVTDTQLFRRGSWELPPGASCFHYAQPTVILRPSSSKEAWGRCPESERPCARFQTLCGGRRVE